MDTRGGVEGSVRRKWQHDGSLRNQPAAHRRRVNQNRPDNTPAGSENQAEKRCGGRVFQGLYVSDEEIKSILDDTYPTNDDNQHIQTLNSLIAEIETQIEEKVIESQKKGIALNLPLLVAIFGLTSFEIDAMLICMALELDTNYERLYAERCNEKTTQR